MNLLDFPLELFREILEHTISKCARCGSSHGVKGSNYFFDLGLARVNRVFEIETFSILEKSLFLIRAPKSRWRAKDSTWEDYHSIALARYVIRKPYEANVFPLDHFPALINAVVDKVLELEGIDQNNELVRKRYILTLCRATGRSAIFGQCRTDPYPESLLRDHVLVASIYLSKSVVVEEVLHLLDSNDRTLHMRSAESEFWGRPLLAAVRTENVPLVCRLLDLGVHHHLEDSDHADLYFKAAVHTKRAKEILSLFRWHQHGPLRREDALHDTIRYSIEVGNLDVANMMLDFHQAIPHCSMGSALQAALRIACGQGLDHVVTRLLDLGLNVNGDGYIWNREEDPAYLACAAGHASTLDILIKNGADSHWSMEEHVLMAVAVKAGHTGVLRILVDAGESLHPLQAFSILDQAAPRPQSSECIWYLLQRGTINLKDLIQGARTRGFHFAHIMTSAAIYGNAEFIEAMFRFGIPIDDNEVLFYTNQDCALPIVAATAYRQTTTVETLKQLGAQEVDPTKSIIARHFQSGLFPSDPPRPEGLQQ
ncbi:uncharacterized protein K460DRAFT_404690 [Cucurbitaria berberidis CBS 394.84]|uniref:Ankyrin n=1 Tax=Cucurbitaria berberidis CBS 394.84 TaxID=1168544 RepID=A0A9P4LCT1_9PLEO|nr:uncharacterized protein K460DRAFT_404690 [Cucurbitaria berberidis CBS 394.84]KAF1849469.1 hypothetical protein K460DRAFT_404690 [Cucurbitaria berberidis CBS 394.84]